MTIQRITGGEIMINQEQAGVIRDLLTGIEIRRSWKEYFYEVDLTNDQIIYLTEKGVEGFFKYEEKTGYSISYIGYWGARQGSSCLLLVS